MDQKKKKLIAFALAILVIAVFSGTTLAYYTVTGTATNVVTSGNIRLEIHEETDGGRPFPKEGVVVIPGDTVTKQVTVKNACDHPFWLRVELVKSSNEETLSPEEVLQIVDLNREDWTQVGDYYYYNDILRPKNRTEPLFTKVHIAGDKVDQHNIGTALTITVKASAVQSENNPAEHPWEASGWPAA